MRNVHRLFVLPALALIGGGAALRAQIKPNVTLSGSAPIAYKFPAPATLTAAQIGPGAVQLSWSAVSGASAYVVSGPGLASGGMTVNATIATISGMQGPGMLTFKVAAATKVGLGMEVGAPATQTVWVKGTMSGLVTPNLPAPSFQLKGINNTEGARNDWNGVVATTSLALTQNPQSCPYTPMFYYDAAQPPVPAAGYYTIGSTGQVEPDSDPAYNKYTIMNGGNTYFRAPTFPGLKYVAPPTNNTWVFIVDCHNAYSNAVQFHVYPTELTLQSVAALTCHQHQWTYATGTVNGQQVPAVTPGSRLMLYGTGFAGVSTVDQKVIFHLQGNDATSPSNNISRDVVAQPFFPSTGTTVLDPRHIDVTAPDPASVGMMDGSFGVYPQASVSVMKGTQTTSLPVGYQPTSWTPVPGMSAC
jgi:hypothetical protein